MEVLEEGNLMDRVPILLQRDLEFYQTHQRVLQEPICSGVVGGKLDFPRYASFAAVKLIRWWEDEYFASYRKPSGLLHTEKELDEGDFSSVTVKTSDPDKFVQLVTKSADLLLEHIHRLSQESLDHADLSVLTATIGAASVVKNSLGVYMQAATTTICPPKGDENGGALKLSFKQYSQMSEALAERLLDLHCRLLLLYIIQDADCLNWEDTQPFFESERGSYTVQMWWHYMLFSKNDLWNSVPPKMAQKIFAGMLNETLSVLTVRYTQIVTSVARSQLHLVDICNMLLCIAELLPHICESGEAYVGLQLNQHSVILRDIHAKCRDLFYCLLLRGAPLGVLSKVFRKGLDNMEMFSSRHGLPSAWLIFALPRYFPKEQSCQWVTEFADLSTHTAISLDLRVLLAFPEADWSYLLNILLMRDAYLTGIIMRHLIQHLPSSENFKNVAKHSFISAVEGAPLKCEAFLCRGECFNVTESIVGDIDPVGQSNYQIVLSLTYLIVAVGKAIDIKSCLIKSLEENAIGGWSDCLDKRQVWNQKRTPWLEAIMHFVYPMMDCVVEMLINAVENGASMYQAMSLALTCVSEIWDCLPEGLYKVTSLLQDIIPVSTRPLGDSVLFQVVFAALYTELIKTAEKPGQTAEKASHCYAISEAICSIDEDDKHTDQIDLFLKQAKESIHLDTDRGNCRGGGAGGGGASAVSTIKMDDLVAIDSDRLSHSPPNNYAMELDVGVADYISKVLVSDILTTNIGKQVLKVVYNYLKFNKDWLLEQLGIADEPSPFQGVQGQKINEAKTSVLKSMFFIGNNTPFDQLLTGSLKIDYISWLQMPLSLNPERAWLHLTRRCDFQEDAKLALPELAMVAGINKIMKRRKEFGK
ncbi:uncharacterized protein Dwil_GK20182 [Drosophila willistoni]|uniref:Uncharacterized protein n=1 Tax=Drosophila willistoni TaxID=7260 RepID=B4MXI1_DROWI|nr:uncharacterized protein LOC6643071 [Drosophila willistoni]EDW76750.1 uncharacterized protein Dwil_GK20182 [Drosophila willistoni]